MVVCGSSGRDGTYVIVGLWGSVPCGFDSMGYVCVGVLYI